MSPWILIDNAYKNGARGSSALANRQRDAKPLCDSSGHIHIDLVDSNPAWNHERGRDGTGGAIQRDSWLVDNHRGRFRRRQGSSFDRRIGRAESAGEDDELVSLV